MGKINLNDMKEGVYWFVERYIPRILSCFSFIVAIIFLNFISLKVNATFEKILNSIITFSSIVVGFVGVLLAVLFSIRNTKVIKLLFEKKEKNILKRYFKHAIFGGFSLVGISAILYIGSYLDSAFKLPFNRITITELISSLWFALVIYVITSTYRIISIMMHIVFFEDQNKDEELDGVKMGENNKKELKEEFKKA